MLSARPPFRLSAILRYALIYLYSRGTSACFEDAKVDELYARTLDKASKPLKASEYSAILFLNERRGLRDKLEFNGTNYVLGLVQR